MNQILARDIFPEKPRRLLKAIFLYLSIEHGFTLRLGVWITRKLHYLQNRNNRKVMHRTLFGNSICRYTDGS